MKKRTLALLMVLAMALSLLAACGGGGGEPATSDAPADAGDASTADPAAGGDEDVYTVTYLFEGEPQEDQDRIVEKINEITMRDLNMKLEVIVVPWGTAQQQRQLMLSSGEPLDLVMVRPDEAMGYINAGQIIDLNELIETYSDNIKAAWGEKYYRVCDMGGFIYGVPNMNEMGNFPGIGMRKDLVEQYEIDVDSIKSMEDLDAVFAMMKEKEPALTTCFVAPDQPPSVQMQPVDQMIDTLAVLDNAGVGTTTIVPVTQAESYKKVVYKTREWYEKGYINQDAATTTVGLESAFKSGDIFSALMTWHPNSPDAFGGTELVYAYLGDHVTLSYGGSKTCTAIATNSKDPAKAMQMLDYMFGSHEVMQLLNWGEENIDWVWANDEKTLIKYPDGVTDDNYTYHLRTFGFIPNQFAASAWEGNADPDVGEQIKEFNNSGTFSEAFGFAFNSEGYETTLAALQNVREKYMTALETGSVDPDEYIAMYEAELMENGLEEYITAKQAAFDAWLAEKA